MKKQIQITNTIIESLMLVGITFMLFGIFKEKELLIIAGLNTLLAAIILRVISIVSEEISNKIKGVYDNLRTLKEEIRTDRHFNKHEIQEQLNKLENCIEEVKEEQKITGGNNLKGSVIIKDFI